MSIYNGKKKTTLYKGDFRPAKIYKGNKKITGYTLKTISGQSVTINGTYNDTPDEIRLDGGFIPSKNLFDIKWIAENCSTASLTDDGISLTGYVNNTTITPEEFLSLTGLSAGDKVKTSLIVDMISGEAIPAATGRICFPNRHSTAFNSYVYLTIAQATYTATIPQNFNSDNYHSMNVYGGQGSAVISNLMMTKDLTATEYEPYIEPTCPIFNWNGEEIEIPYVLYEGDCITVHPQKDAWLLRSNGEKFDISDTEIGQKLMSLKTTPNTTSASISEGTVSITAKISD